MIILGAPKSAPPELFMPDQAVRGQVLSAKATPVAGRFAKSNLSLMEAI